MKSAPSFTIRNFERADHDAALALMDELNRHEASHGARRRTGLPAAEACLAEDAAKAGDSGGRIVLDDHGEILAYATYRLGSVPAFLPEAGRPELFVENLVVAERARGRGLGRAMLEELFRRAQLAGAARVILHVVPDNATAIQTYRQAGFTMSALEMELTLDAGSEKPA